MILKTEYSKKSLKPVENRQITFLGKTFNEILQYQKIIHNNSYEVYLGET